MACGCAADGGEPRNTVGAPPPEISEASAAEEREPRSTTVVGMRPAGGESTAASVVVEPAKADTTPLVNSTAWTNRPARCIAVLLRRSLRQSFTLWAAVEKRGEVPRLRWSRGIAI